MTEDTESAADSFKFSDLRKRFEGGGGGGGANPLRPERKEETGRDSRPPSRNALRNGDGGNDSRPPSRNDVRNGGGGEAEGGASTRGNELRPPSSNSNNGLTATEGGAGRGSDLRSPTNNNGVTNGSAGAGGQELPPPRPLPPAKPLQPMQQLQVPQQQQLQPLRPPALPTKPAHAFGSRPGPSTARVPETSKDLWERRGSEEGLLPRKKPPLAPKPRHLLADYVPAPATPERHESLASEKAEALESVRVRAKRIADQLYAQAERRMSVRIAMEGGSSVPGTPIALTAPGLPTMHDHGVEEGEEVRVEMDEISHRPHHHQHDSDSEDAYADSDSEESRSTADTQSNQEFGRRSGRYASSTSGYGSSDLHSAIMRELASKGIAPGSNGSSLPHSIGKMRAESKRNQPRSVSGSALHASSPSKSDICSIASSSAHSYAENASGSGIVAISASSGPSFIQEAPDVPDYNTGDEKEDGRLKKLHYAALEFLTVQRTFVEYLNMIINIYPSYLAEYGEHVGRTILAAPSGSSTMHVEGLHVVQRVQKLLIPYHEFHKLLLKDIGEMMEEWSSLTPRMSTIFVRTAPFLKQCVPFLKEKSKIADEMTRLLKEDAEFAAATLSFEQRVFNRGVGAVIQQLDQVHQNFMRYKLLMQSYIKFLPEDSEEWKRTDGVISMLEKINMEVNQSMGLPTSDQLMRLATLFQGQFDVFKPGRRLIRQENVDKQTRKDLQPRILVLFSDTLWLCRVMSSLGSAGMFDMARSYAIPIEEVRLEITPHFDYDTYMEIRSKRKSAGLWFKCASARDEWATLIEKAKGEMIALRERLQGARKRSSRASAATASLLLSSPGSRRSSGAASSDPSIGEAHQMQNGNGTVPTRTAPPPPPLARPHSIVIAESGGAAGGSKRSSRRLSEDTHEDDDDYARSNEDDDDDGEAEEAEELVTPVVGGLDPINGTAEERRASDPRKGPRHKVSVTASSSHSNSPSLEIGEQPVWINDQMSTKCLMDGCENAFNLLHRRHHCRNCGWLICKKCRGYAPVQRLRFEREIVCPECYDDIEYQYTKGLLFPPNFLIEVERGVYWLAVTKGKKGKERIERVNPATLFSPPHNRGLKRMQNIDQRMRQGGTVYGKVFLKTKRGEAEMHAHLADEGLVLAFYKAAFDKQPTEQHVIYGFSLTEEDPVTESGKVLSGKRFILRHRNQHGAESQHVISFRVVSDTATKMWSAALRKALREESLDDEED